MKNIIPLFLFIFLLNSCSSEPEQEAHNPQLDTVLVLSGKNVDSVFVFKQHIFNSTTDTDIIFNVHITANSETDTVWFSKPGFAGIASDGNFLYRKDTLRLSKNYSGHVILNFDPGDTAHRVTLRCDTFRSIFHDRFDMEYPEYFFTGNIELLTRNTIITTNDLYTDTYQKTFRTEDSVSVVSGNQVIRGTGFRMEDLFLNHWQINKPIGVVTLSPEKP